MDKGKVVTAIIVIATVILAGVAVFTALRLYDKGPEPVSPSAPASQPQASGTPKACEALVFNLEQPSPTPTDKVTPSPTPTGTTTPTATPTTPIGGGPSPTPTNTPTPTKTATPTPTDVPGSTSTPTPTSVDNPTSTPTASPTVPGGTSGDDDELPQAGNEWPVFTLGLAGILLAILGLALVI